MTATAPLLRSALDRFQGAAMRVGVPREIKVEEHRVGLVPASVRELATRGHEVLFERGAGTGIGASDEEYNAAGARLASADEIWRSAELIVKVKEPQPVERKRLLSGQTLITYLHLGADRAQALDLAASGATCIAYETVAAPGGQLPLLAPMSEVAGRMAVQVGAHYLEIPQGGRGILLGGVPGVLPGKTVVLGAGTVGSSAVAVAVGMQSETWVLGQSVAKLRALAARFGPALRTLVATRDALEQHVLDADLVIGAVLVPGASAPKLVSRHMIEQMRPGAVVVDVSIDQGGCFETSRPTTHADPTYVVNGVVHYCVTNMPGAVPRTSAFALNNATLPFVVALAEYGVRGALERDPQLLAGLNVHRGAITHLAVAASLGLDYVEPAVALARG